MQLGLALGGDFRGVADLASRAEALGYESVWCAETSRTPFVQAAVACMATERVTIGTNVALAFPRSPTVLAMTARDLSELSGGRFVLGLGSQVKRVNEQRFSIPFEHPAPKLGEAVEAIRAVLATFDGQPVDHRGRFYTITMPPFPGAGPPPGPIPIYLAAVNERMLETAGRVADGVVGHPLTSTRYLTEVVRPAIARGAATAGRDPSEVNLTGGVILQISDDRDQARFEAATQIGFYATTRTYRPVLALHGFEALVEPLREAFAAGDFRRLAEVALPMVDDFAVAGTPEECRERLAAYEGLVDRLILGGMWVGAVPERIEQNHRAVMETFAPARS